MIKRLLRLFRRDPDFTIVGKAGDPYIRRWYVIPRNRSFNIYLHNQVRDDEDPWLHDHPWWNISIVLRGGYWEIVPAWPIGVWLTKTLAAVDGRFESLTSARVAHRFQPVTQSLGMQGHKRIWRGPGSVIHRYASDAHRLELGRSKHGWHYFDVQRQAERHDRRALPSWSLFVTGPNRRKWGFWKPEGWVPYHDHIDTGNGVSRPKG